MTSLAQILKIISGTPFKSILPQAIIQQCSRKKKFNVWQKF